MKKEIITYIIDSFTDTLFKGNPAGVCFPSVVLTEGRMLSIAKELGLSETAFVIHKEEYYSIRYFSPKMEIELCGHATLASAKAIFDMDPNCKQIHFKNIQGLDLMISKDGENIIMKFPAYDTTPAKAPQEMLDALGIESVVNCEYNKETTSLLLELNDCQLLRNLQPDFAALYKSHDSISGVSITARSEDEEYDFESRFFWPWSGTNEDPVTGGVHTFLVKYWYQRLGKRKMRSFQCSERSGFMDVELVDDDVMIIKSQAQIVFEGKLRLN